MSGWGRGWVILFASCVGCLQADDVGIGETETALTGFSNYTWGCAGDCPDLDMGSDANRTCVLRGVRGNLAPPARVGIERRADGHYWLDVYSGDANELMADVVCLPTVTNRTGQYWAIGNNTTIIPAGTTGARRCFLSSILTNVANADAFSQATDYARVTKNLLGGSWQLTNSQSVSPYASAWIGATCVDAEYVFSSSQSIADVTVSGDAVASPVASESIQACAVNRLGGHFDGPYEEGAWLYYQGDLELGQWRYRLSNGVKSISWICVQ
jgi:hypothetical protein